MPDASSLEHEIAQDRAQLDRTLSALNQRLSPSQPATAFGTAPRGAGVDLMEQVCRYLAANTRGMPLPLALASTGLCWYLDHKSGKAPAAEAVRQPLYGGAKPAAEPAPRLEDLAVATLDEVRKHTAQLRERIAEGTEDLPEEARQRVIAARRKAVDAIENARDKAADGARQGVDYVKDHPMVVGGAALALGATVAGIVFARRNSGDDAADDAFAHADHVLAEELQKVRGVPHETVLARINDG